MAILETCTGVMAAPGEVKEAAVRRKILLVAPLFVLFLASTFIANAQCGGPSGCWEDRETIWIYGNSGFTPENGVVAGCGSAESPYVIEGWRIVPRGADFGINIERTTKHFVIRNCIIEQAPEAAIRLYGVSNASIERCQLLSSGCGLLLENSSGNSVVGNLIAENRIGASTVLGSKLNVSTKNSFVSNGRSAKDPSMNLWYCGNVGNYWTDYQGEDRNCDGVGDEPYWHPVVDRYPLIVSPWQCALPLTDQCASHCTTSTAILNEIAASGQPCAVGTPCAASTPCAPPCEPTVQACADQTITCSRPVVVLTSEFRLSKPSCEPTTVVWTKTGGGVVGTSPTIEITEPGVYAVTVTGADGCRVSDTVLVTADYDAPVVRATADQQLSCAVTRAELRAEVSGGSPPCDIEWRGPDGGVVGRGPNITVAKPGTYTVRAVGANGCSAVDTVVVSEDAGPPAVNAWVDQALSCAVPAATLTAVVAGGRPPYTYEWTKPGGIVVGRAGTASVQSPGTYTLTITGSNGCSATSAVIVAEDAAPPVVDALVDRSITCLASTAVLTANISQGRAPYTISWTDPRGRFAASTPVITVSEPGSYTVTVTGANGCSATDSVTVSADTALPMVDAGPDQTLSEERTPISLAAKITRCPDGYTATWEDTLGTVVGRTESITVSEPGTYRVTVVRTATGCSASDEVVVNSTIVSKVMLDSTIEGLSVFGQLTLDGVPIPGTVFFFKVSAEQAAGGNSPAALFSLAEVGGKGFKANGAEINYIIPGNAIVTFLINREQFFAGKKYYLLHLPTDPPGEASVAFF